MAFELDLPPSSSPQQAARLNFMHMPARTSQEMLELAKAFGGHALTQTSSVYHRASLAATVRAPDASSRCTGLSRGA